MVSAWRPRTWRPAILTTPETLILTIVLAGIAIIRAYDYATPPLWSSSGRFVSPGLAATEAVAPLWLWVALLCAGGVVLLGAVIARIHAGVALGHSILLVVYTGLAAGMTIEYSLHAWADGMRSAGPLWVVALLHLCLLLRTGWRFRA